MRISLSPLRSMSKLSTTSLLTLILCLLIFSTLSFAAAPDRITSPIVPGQLIRLSGGVPMQAQSKFDQGPVDPSLKLSYMTLLTVPSASQQKAITKLLAQQQDPSSPQYHKWLTPEQYADRFGLSVNDINKITAWLQSQGFAIVRTARARNFVVFSGTAAQVEKTFQTEIHSFDVDGQMHFSNTTPPLIPAALSGIVTGFHGFNNFRPKSQAKRGDPAYTFANGGSDYYFLAPGDIATIYDVGPLQTGLDGTGQKLAVMGQTGIYQSDLTNFRQNFQLSAISCTTTTDIITACTTSNFAYVLVNGTATTIYDGDLPEADLDVEWSGATAPKAQVIFVTATDPNGDGVWDSWYHAVDNDLAPVITMSYTAPCELGEAEFSAGGAGTVVVEGTFTSDEAELKKANLEGITFMNSAGDTGAAECDYGNNVAVYGYAAAYPASSQYVTAVGGTSIPGISPNEYSSTYWNTANGSAGSSAKSYIPEQPWNDAQEFGLKCAAAPTSSFCEFYGIVDWLSAQEALGISAGGGGISNCVAIDANGVCTTGFPQPSWQSGISASAINPSGFGVTSTPARYTPDVSLLASANFPGYLICSQEAALGGTSAGSVCDSPTTGITDMLNACLAGTGPCAIFGGTSVSSPVFAGMVTLLNQYLGATGLGNINPTLYTLAKANSTNHAFNRVTTGSTGSYSDGAWCQEGTPTSGVTADPWPTALQCPSSGANAGFLGFNAYNADTATGYNLVTGLGSVDLNKLAIAWAASLTSTTTTTVTSSSNPAFENSPVTFTATVTTTGTHAPTGTVTFNDGTTDIGSGTLSTVSGSQVATFTTSALAVGSHSITAVYGGDTNNGGSTSAVLTQTVAALPSTSTAISSSSNPAGYAAAVTFTATVTITGTHAATGTVTFKDGTTTLGSPTLNGSQVATFTTSTLAVGSHSITAVYSGDANNEGSTSAVLTQVITAPTFTFSTPTGPTPGTVLSGQPSTSTFTITPGGGTFAAQVTFACNGLPTDGTMTCTASPIAAGTTGAKQVTVNITTTGPNTAGGIKNLRRRADNRSPLLPFALPLAGIVMVGFAGRKMSKYSAIAALCASLVLLGLLVACGSSNTPAVGISVSPEGATVFASGPAGANWPPQTASFTATLTNTNNMGVTWAVTTANGGSITSAGAYTAPTIAAGLPKSATITATSAADSSKVATATVTLTPTTVPGPYSITVTATEGPTQNTTTPIALTVD